MKSLSTFQIILLVVFGSVGVSGILIFALLTAGQAGSNLGAVTVWGTFEEVGFKALLRDAADLDDRLLSVTYIQKDSSAYEQELTSALANGRGPDLFFMRDDYAFRNASYAIPISYEELSRTQFETTFIDAASPFLAPIGVIAVPVMVDPLVLFWNKEALSASGFTQPPQFWGDLPAMVTELTKKDEGGSIVRGGIALGAFDNIGAAKPILATMILQAGGLITARDNDGVLRSALAADGSLDKAVGALRFYTEFADPAQEDYSWTRAFPNAQGAFAAGDVAMYIGFASERDRIARANPNLDFALAPFPQIEKGGKIAGNSRTYGLAISNTSKNLKGAKIIAYLMAAPEMSQPISKMLNMTSAMRSLLSAADAPTSSDPNADALGKIVQNSPKTQEKMLNYQATISRAWLDPDPQRTDLIFRGIIEDTVSGAQKFPEAVRRADKQLSDILDI
jgi:ABC-type glycerol-3-phosphate transport system substrate-binding protein